MPRKKAFEYLILNLIKAAQEAALAPGDETKERALHAAHLAVIRAHVKGD